MKKPSFSVVSFCLVVLALFGFAVERLRSKIPDREPNRLRYESSEFLVQGSRSEVDWRPLEPAAFAEARRTGKPILLLIGVPWSKSARDADDQIFKDREVVSFLNRYVICIRIDAQADPRWLGAFLPLRRPAIPMLVGFQVWFLTPEGELFDDGGQIGTLEPIDPDKFGDVLVRARERLRDIRAGNPNAPIPGVDQETDERLLSSVSLPQPVDFEFLESSIAREQMTQLGGFVRFGRVKPAPGVLQYLLLTGQYDAFQRLADATLRSPLVDWLDGGFFRSYVPTAPMTIEFDKLALANAELMSVYAKAGEFLHDPDYRRVAEATFDALARDFEYQGLVAACQVGDEGVQGRSGRYSFSPKRIREVLLPDEREIARSVLGLRVEENRTMAVWVRNPSQGLAEPAAGVLMKLRNSRSTAARLAGKREADVHGFVVARMLECARLWGGPDRLQEADELFARLDWFRANDDVQHTLESGNPNRPYLGDYLAYADAALQHFLAMGRADSFEHGRKVLERARFLFETDVSGVWRTSIDEHNPLMPKNVEGPEVLDFARESCSAMAIRLCNAYGKLLREPSAGPSALSAPSSSGLRLLQAAQNSATQWSGLTSHLGIEGAGLYCSMLRAQNEECAIVVGRDAVATARRLYAMLPTRLVAPAIGEVRPGLQRKGPGVYVVRGTDVQGPYSVQEAASRLSPVLLK